MNVCLFVLVRRLQRSTYWLWIDATRHDQLAAEMSGIEASQVQEAVFVLSAGCAAIAGALFVNFTTFVVPDDFTFVAGLPIILYVVLGRFDPLKCVLATVLMYSAYEVIKLRLFGLLGETVGEVLSDWKDGTFAAVLVIAVITPALTKRWRRTRT